jgi:hypothetical protein
MQRQISLVYIHIGTNLPKYIYDSLYQTLLISEYKTKIYVIIEDSLVDKFNNEILKFNYNMYFKSDYCFSNVIQIIPLSLLDLKLNVDSSFNQYKNVITNKYSNLAEFRNGFWISTTARFYYISMLMEMFNLKNVFHIENDIMLYESPNNIYEYICEHLQQKSIDKICMIQDAPNRTIPSILYFPDSQNLSELTKYITNELEFSQTFINDMNILGSFPNKHTLPILPNQITKTNGKKIIFDGAAIGQYLGGVDYRNLPNYENNKLIEYNNPSKGFINETSIIKPDKFNFSNTNVILEHLNIPIKIKTFREIQKSELYQIANLHIHSKQLYQFSSIFDIQYNDIITGDRILTLCDFVILTKDIYQFHSGINNYAKDIILVKNFNDINLDLLNKYFLEYCDLNKITTIKLFIYTHILEPFTKFILPFLNDSIKYILYIHNSDHSFTNDYKTILDSPKVKKVYSQNIDIEINDNNDKLSLLPIGIANSMWSHGNLEDLYTVMQETYKNQKTNSVYVNINPNTYDYRKKILDKIIYKNNFNVSSNKPYIEYLRELASHRFSLCIRGNGIDTHRFWESLYLGVIPIIINNKTTKCNNFIKYLNKLQIPFYEIINDNLDIMFTKYNNTYFNEILYKKLLEKYNTSIFNLDSLKLSYYH